MHLAGGAPDGREPRLAGGTSGRRPGVQRSRPRLQRPDRGFNNAWGSADARIPVGPSAPQGRDPLPFPSRNNALRAIVLRLGGFRDQRDLLEFALALEDLRALAEVSLTRAEPADAWFAVRAVSTQQVVAALQEVRGWLISAAASDSYVEGRVESAPIEIASEAEPVLPHRPRFRVFSPQRALSPVSAGFTIARPAAMQAATEAGEPAAQESLDKPPVAAPELVPDAELAAAQTMPAYTAPPMPVLPMPVRTAPVPQPEIRFTQPTRPVLPAAQATAEPAVNRPGGAVPVVEHLTLVVYPFHSFVALNEFQGAIRVLRGVTNTRVRRFYRGTLHLTVDYEDIIPLAERLQDLRGFRWQTVSESRHEIELLLEDSGAVLAAEGDG